MDEPRDANRTQRQAKWFATVQANFEAATGKSLEAWAEIVRRDGPETGRRAREKWLKDTYGLSMVRAGQVLMSMEPSATPTEQRDALWHDADARAFLTAFEALIAPLPEVTPTQRKGYSAWSRTFQFAAMKPVKGGAAIGLAVSPDLDQRLSPARNEGWSERLKSTLRVTSAQEIGGLAELVRAAADNG